MAGVVAMAAVIEDFETQPCKKPRKDGDSPGAKTITNYFSPVPKTVDKHFSPPRSSNIMDYFSRKPPSSSKETGSPLEQSKENCQRLQSTEKQAGATQLPGKPSQRQTKRKSKVARKLQKNEAVTSSVDESGETMGEPVRGCDSPSMLCSDTGALLDQPCAKSLTVDKLSDGRNTETLSAGPTQKDGSRNGGLKSGKRAKVKPKSNDINGLSPVGPLKDKAKPARSRGNPRKNKTKEEKPPPTVPDAKEVEQSLYDVSMEVNVDEYSQLNHSTVTVSFEDFLQSQNQGDGAEEVGDKGEDISEVEEMDTAGQLEVALTKEKTETSHQNISPRTLTFQAEVHAVSMEPVKSAKRLASIFTKRKEADFSLSPPAPTEHSPPSPTTLPPKRKSNVVLQEDDLELAVVESVSTPKCSQAERKQFMAAFKRPGPDRAKPGKSQAKQKQPAETAADEGEEEATVEPPGTPSDAPAAVEENTRAKKKTAAKGKKKASKKKEVTPSRAPAASTPEEEPEAAVERTEATTTAAGAADASTLPVRRSKREALPRQAPDAEGAAHVRTSRRQQRGEMADLLQDSPLQMSTPKSCHRSKHSMYKADLVCPPDKRGSPIRIKFTRIQRNASKGRTDWEKPSPLASKTPVASKKKTQAKRLVERAKVIQQQSKKTAMLAEEKTSVRRSSRSQAITSKAYIEDEDSVIYMENAQATPTVSEKSPKKKSKQRLRSLNDVLGKATAQASKVAPLFQDRKLGRPSAVGSIFEEGSREGSENSLDDEVCRARRQFLKSGLPDSFKKLIVKTTATMEAYSLSCSSFHPVVHVLQTPKDCPLWSLPWPVSSSLRSVKDSWCLPSSPVLTHEGLLQLTTAPAQRALCDWGSGQRPELSDQVRQLLMEEVSSSDPSFPAQRFFMRFLNRRDHHLQQTTATETATPGSLAEPLGGKRKRVTEGETPGKLAKKQRSVCTKEDDQHTIPTPEPEHSKRGGCGRGGRAQKRKLQKEEQELKAHTALETASTPAPAQVGSVIVLDDSPLAGSDGKEDVMKEDLLWTEKYQPQHSSDVIGNTASVRKLHSWLKEWKLRTAREERKKQKETRPEEGNDSDWDCCEDSSQELEDMLCNTLLITGPTGVGKTAAVYACAQELGFKVFEVNSSSQRSGRLILSQLKEATQSHQVDIQGVNAHKPTYFNSYSTSNPTGFTRPGLSPRKVNSPRRVVSSPSKHPQSPKGAKRGSLAPTSLASFFKMGRPSGKTEAAMSNKITQPPAAPKKSIKRAEDSSKMKEPVAASGAGGGVKESSGSGEEQNKKTATSLILFEEVDVIFDEDSGFLAAIKTFMTTTKRPVILTTSDPHFSTMFDGYLEEIHFTTPSMVNVSSYLRLLCLTEDTRTDAQDVSTLLSLNNCDIRQSLLQLQFWTRSTGGRHRAKQSDQLDGIASKAELKIKEPACASSWGGSGLPDLPLRDTGCAESMLGLLNIQPQGSVQDLLKRPLKETAACWELVADCRRRRVDLLYSNMHTLLPLPVTQLPVSTLSPLQMPSQPCPAQMDPSTSATSSARPRLEAPPPHSKALKLAELGDAVNDGSPVKVSQRMRKHKRLAKKDLLHSDSDSEGDFLSLAKPVVTAQGKEEESVCAAGARDALHPPQMMRREPLTPKQRAISGPVSRGLAAIADFLDDMSYMDACSPQGGGGGQGRGPYIAQPLAQVKDGMVDEARLEDPGLSSMEAERAVEIQAAVEALSFQRCLVGVTEAQGEAQALGGGELGEQAGLELSLPVASHQRGFSLTPHPPCQPKLLQKCREVSTGLLSKGVFNTLGSRPELSLEYLPTLRTICRAEQLKEQGKVKRRFLHYLDFIHLGLPRDTLQHLAGDFP